METIVLTRNTNPDQYDVLYRIIKSMEGAKLDTYNYTLRVQDERILHLSHTFLIDMPNYDNIPDNVYSVEKITKSKIFLVGSPNYDLYTKDDMLAKYIPVRIYSISDVFSITELLHRMGVTEQKKCAIHSLVRLLKITESDNFCDATWGVTEEGHHVFNFPLLGLRCTIAALTLDVQNEVKEPFTLIKRL